jgi:hypothetical protein
MGLLRRPSINPSWGDSKSTAKSLEVLFATLARVLPWITQQGSEELEGSLYSPFELLLPIQHGRCRVSGGICQHYS